MSENSAWQSSYQNAIVARHRGDLQCAKQHMVDAVSRARTFASAKCLSSMHNYLASISLELGDLQNAEESLKQAIGLEQKNSISMGDHLSLLARVLYEMGENERAVDCAHKAREEFVVTQHTLGISQMDQLIESWK